MIAVLKKETTKQQLDNLTEWLKAQGLDVHVSEGKYQTIVGLVGDVSKIDEDLLTGLEMVESVKRISESSKPHKKKKTVGIVGLGLIGGSMAKAYKASGEWRVLAFDKDEAMLSFSMLADVTDAALTKENLCECDLVLIALYPFAACEYLSDNGALFNKNAIVIDLCGTKKLVCEAGFEAAKKHGFTFVGGHPMAGTHNSGFKYSRENMFNGAPMIIVPPRYDDIELFDRIKNILAPCNFGSYSVTTAEQHDKTIAFTSQLAHVVSNAYVKSPTARGHKGFSAGSYKDLTRVAKLNEHMWAELFLENRENMIFELDSIIGSLEEYRSAISDNDFDRLRDLLRDGRIIKEQVDGK